MANDFEIISCGVCRTLNKIPMTHIGRANCASCGERLARNQQTQPHHRTVHASQYNQKTLGLRQVATGINILILYFFLLAIPHVLELARLNMLDYDDINDQSSGSNTAEVVEGMPCSFDASEEDFFDCIVGQAIQAEAIAFISQCMPLAGVAMISVGLNKILIAQ